LAIAEDALGEAREAAQRDTKLVKKRSIAELKLQKARFAHEVAQAKRKLLVDYTRGKRIKELRTGVEIAHSGELAKKAIWELESSKAKKLERQIAASSIKAPIDGTLVYAKLGGEPSTGGARMASSMMMMSMMGGSPSIRQGAFVSEGQLLFEIIPAAESGRDKP
jgi:hypothetical protein